jgi:hypothetical protein
MKILEILLEYDRNITAEKLGPQLLNVGRKDGRFILIKNQEDPMAVDTILWIIEAYDPTPNKEYTLWLVKMYIAGNLNVNDIDTNLLRAHWMGKRRGMIQNPRTVNIGNFRTYAAFADAMNQEDIEKILTPKRPNKGDAREVYRDDTVRIIILNDTLAACYYGIGTKWCTSSTENENEFDAYNKGGTLFVLLPKKRQYPTEKFQIYIDNDLKAVEVKNDRNQEVDQIELLKNRFAGALDFFQTKYPTVFNN